MVDEALAGDAELGRLSAPRLLERLDLDPLAREVLIARLETSAASPADTVPAAALAESRTSATRTRRASPEATSVSPMASRDAGLEHPP